MQTSLTIAEHLVVYFALIVFWGSIAAYVLRNEKKMKAH